MIKKAVKEILSELPSGVSLVAAAKTRSVDEVRAAIAGGVKVLGYNYVQEAEQMYRQIGADVKWHMIGHLQRNKVKKVVPFIDMIETVDSQRLAETIDRFYRESGKVIPVLIEINSGREEAKTGVLPENALSLINSISHFSHISIQGLMTMAPYGVDPEECRPYFRQTKQIFEQVARAQIKNVEMRYLSMGMSDSYQVAIEEGANIVRIGTKLFGPRE